MNPGGAQFCPTELPCFLPLLTESPPISQSSVKIKPDKVQRVFSLRRMVYIPQLSNECRKAGACLMISCYLVAEALC